MACASGARAEPDVEDETGQLTGMVGIDVVVSVVELDELELPMLVVVELVVVMLV